jgi:hypothetical protein
MESVLKKIFTGKKDEEVHGEFIKYSRGIFLNKYLVDAKKKGTDYSIKTGAEFANFFVKYFLSKIKGEVEIKGVIVSTFDIRTGMGGFVFNPEEEVKQFMGIKQLKVNGKIETKKILEVMEKYPRAFFALTFKGEGFELKIKEKAPKSAKPSTKGEAEIKADFCSLKTNDKGIAEDLFFDFADFKEIKINHTIQIEDIDIDKNEKDPVLMREKAVKKGKIIRKATVDGKVHIKDYKLEA